MIDLVVTITFEGWEVLYTDRVGADGVPHPSLPGGCVVSRGPSGKFIFLFCILLFFSVYIFSFKKIEIFLNPFILESECLNFYDFF
jgi:hypothetical protein